MLNNYAEIIMFHKLNYIKGLIEKKKIKLKLISKFQRITLETKKEFRLAFLYTGHDSKLMHFMYLF